MKKLFYLYTILITASNLFAMAPVKEKIGSFPFESLPDEMKVKIVKFALNVGDKSPEAVIQSYKNFINLKRTNNQLYSYLTKIVDEKNNLNVYQKYLLNNLSEDDFNRLNKYIDDTLWRLPHATSTEIVMANKTTTNLNLLIDLLTKLNKLNVRGDFGRNYFITAVRLNLYQLVSNWLVKHKELVNKPDIFYPDNTPIIEASKFGHTRLVKLLIDSGADVNAKSKYKGTTALMYASSASGTNDIVKLLLDANADVNTANSDGRTALDMAHEVLQQAPNLRSIKDNITLLESKGAKRGAAQPSTGF